MKSVCCHHMVSFVPSFRPRHLSLKYILCPACLQSRDFPTLWASQWLSSELILTGPHPSYAGVSRHRCSAPGGVSNNGLEGHNHLLWPAALCILSSPAHGWLPGLAALIASSHWASPPSAPWVLLLSRVNISSCLLILSKELCYKSFPVIAI